jgi:hypothetical protein
MKHLIYSPIAKVYLMSLSRIKPKKNNGTNAEESMTGRNTLQGVQTIQPFPESCRSRNTRNKARSEAHQHGKEGLSNEGYGITAPNCNARSVPMSQRTTVRGLMKAEWESETEKTARERFDRAIEDKLGKNAKPSDFSETPDVEAYSDDSDGPEQRIPEADDYDADAFDKYLGAETLLSSGDLMLHGIMKTRKRDADGDPIGKTNYNPLLDTHLYDVELSDGNIKEYAANVIAESIYSQVDDEGRHQLVLLDALVDHERDNTAVSADDGYIVTNGNRHRKLTTKGWKLCVKWKDGSTSWEALKDLKESNPVEVAEYAVSAKLVSEPAFAWWGPFTLTRRDRIIAKIDSRFAKKHTQVWNSRSSYSKRGPQDGQGKR